MLDNIGHPQHPTENQIQHLIKLYTVSYTHLTLPTIREV